MKEIIKERQEKIEKEKEKECVKKIEKDRKLKEKI